MNKKAYTFLLDVFVAVLIIIIGVGLIFFGFPDQKPQILATEQIAEDVVGLLFHTFAKDLCINPGEDFASCSCPLYSELEQIVCFDSADPDEAPIENIEANLLTLFSEVIERGIEDGPQVEKVFYDLLVENDAADGHYNVVDEKRFGFAILYTTPDISVPLELYNTETYVP